MTLEQLLHYLDHHLDQRFLDGNAGETLAKARAGGHHEPVAGEILVALMDGAGADSPEKALDRASAVKAIGPLRLQYMKDDAPVEGFRLVEKTITTIDAAYNEEALAAKQG